jgi:hypothetical protein
MNGQPSSAGPLKAGSVPGWDSTRIAGDQSENPLGMATAGAAMPPAATSASAALTENFMSDHLLGDGNRCVGSARRRRAR